MSKTNASVAEECPKSHIPNEATRKAIENIKNKKGLKRVNTVTELFEQLKR